MLLELRKVTRGAVASVILGLIGFAMVLFLVPRNGFQNPFAQYLVKVGDTQITRSDVDRELDAALERQRQNGHNFTREDAIAQGAHLQIIDGLIGRAALGSYAKRIGVEASDSQVAEQIRQMDGVTDPVSHRFDERLYAMMLQQNHYTGPQFEALVRNGVSTSMVMRTLALGARAPSSFGAMAVVMNTETRTTTVAQAPMSLAGNVAPPTADQLQTFYDQIKSQLMLPEFRQLTLVLARKADFVAHTNITEDQVTQEFNSRAPRLGTPETRTSVRIVAQNQVQANAVATQINAGQAPDAVARAQHLQVIHGADELRAAVTDPRVADAVFSMPANAPARVVQSSLGTFVVVRTLDVKTGVTPTLAAYHDQIKQELQTAAASTLIDTALNNFEEARAGGSTATQAAQSAGLTVVAVPAVEAQGRDMHAQPVPAIAGQAELLRAAFHTSQGEASDFIQTTDGEALVSVDRITAPHPMAFADVHDQLIAQWRLREVNRRLAEISSQVTQAVQHGQDFATAARAHHLQIVMTSTPIDQGLARAIPAAQLGGQIFSAQANAVVSDRCVQQPRQPLHGLCAQGNEFLIAHVERINRVDPATMPAVVEQARTQIQREIAQSFAETIEAQIVDDAHAQKNQDLITRTYPTNTEGGAGDEGQ